MAPPLAATVRKAFRDRGRVVSIQAVHLLDETRVGAQIVEISRSFCHHTFIVYHTGNLRKPTPQERV